MQKHFEEVQRAIRDAKWRKIVKRAELIQKRAKIKPSALNPVLLNSPLRGGDAMDVDPPLNLYWPMN